MRKFIVLALSAVMCLSMSMTAFAAPSISEGNGQAVLADGTTVNVKVAPVAAERAAEVSTQEGLKEIMGDAYTGEMTVAFSQDVTLPEGAEIPEGGLKITFRVNAIKAGMEAKVLHYTGGKWEVLPATIEGDGLVSATFKSLSPVVIVYKTPADGGSASDGGSSSGSSAPAPAGTASPKTGETNLLMMAGLVGVFCAVMAVASGVQMKKNR